MDLNLEKQLNLSKDFILDLSKKSGLEGQISKVVLCLDYSGSMDGLYRNGTVQKVLERIVPIAMAFDDDQEMELFIFHDGVHRVIPNVTVRNIEGYIAKLMKQYSFGGTNYAPAINEITNDFLSNSDNVTAEVTTTKSGGVFGFGGTKVSKADFSKPSKAKYPAYVIFITDGENFDKPAAERAIQDASRHGLFFQFVGLKAGYGSSFNFLEKLDNMGGRFVDNANFFEMTDRDMVNSDNSVLYGKLLNEYPSWVKAARSKGIIV